MGGLSAQPASSWAPPQGQAKIARCTAKQRIRLRLGLPYQARAAPVDDDIAHGMEGPNEEAQCTQTHMFCIYAN